MWFAGSERKKLQFEMLSVVMMSFSTMLTALAFPAKAVCTHVSIRTKNDHEHVPACVRVRVNVRLSLFHSTVCVMSYCSRWKGFVKLKLRAGPGTKALFAGVCVCVYVREQKDTATKGFRAHSLATTKPGTCPHPSRNYKVDEILPDVECMSSTSFNSHE